jgi:MFS family permease
MMSNTHPGWRLWLRIVPAFALGYFLSYGLRSVNAVIAPEIMRELAFSASDLGLLTSAYFLGFGLFQIPLGLLLDRFGPRRVEAVLLLLAAAGCLVFAKGHSLPTLAGGRALIGLGVSACLMGSFKAFSQWFPMERMPALTATIMIAGGLGALSSSLPVAMVLPWLGWRGVLYAVAGVLVLSSALLMTVPEHPGLVLASSWREQMRSLRAVYCNRVFWRYAPQANLAVGGFMALHGLWAVPWLMTVDGLSRAEAAQILFDVALAMLAGFFFVATCSGWLLRRGIRPMHLLTFGMGLGVLAGLSIVLGLAEPQLMWPVLGFAFSLSNIAYPLLTGAFPVAFAGRVNTALNLAAFVGAFALQWGIGAAIDGLGALGVERLLAYKFTLAGLVACQALAYLWFLQPVNTTSD